MEPTTTSILSGWTVRRMMRTDVVTVPGSMSVSSLAKLLTDHGISGAPVTEAGKVIGVVSQSDIVQAVAKKLEGPSTGAGGVPADIATRTSGDGDVSSFFHRTNGELYPPLPGLTGLPEEPPASLTVADVMMPARFSVRPSASLGELARFFVNSGVHRALVMDEGELVGIVTTLDVLNAIAESDVAG
ncbi:MAG: CBS domain-containing protein [Gemmatimonadetes bacterium]|nr:CBS domain-containing protein [Gemmatimonadota bacterium]